MSDISQVIDWLEQKIEQEGSIIITEAAVQVSSLFGTEFATLTEGGAPTLISAVKRKFNRHMGNRIRTELWWGDWTWFLNS